MVIHDVIRGFKPNYGTGTDTIRENILHQIAVMCKVVMYYIFLYHHKAYNAMNQ